jgi:Integrase core domain
VLAAFRAAIASYGAPAPALTGPCSPGGSSSPGLRWCCSSGSAGRTASPSGSPGPRPPTTTGKIERLHQSLQIELLDDHGRFDSIEALQAALDSWREEYNTDRPHQSLNMAFPVSRFAPADSPLELRLPAQLTDRPAATGQNEQPQPTSGLPRSSASPDEPSLLALEAGQRVTLRMDGTQMTVISHDSAPLRTMPCPVPPRDRHRLRGTRRASISPPPPAGPVIAQRARNGQSGPGP